jgi:hypothetical protein
MDWNAKPPSWMIELDRENNVGLFDMLGGSGYSGSDLILGSTSRSSKSASIGSSSNRDSRTKEYPIESSHAPEHSSVSSEPLLTLKEYTFRMNVSKVSRNTYLFQGISFHILVLERNVSSMVRTYIRATRLKETYHRKHRVCDIHSRSPKVIVAGLESRFCQQCRR